MAIIPGSKKAYFGMGIGQLGQLGPKGFQVGKPPISFKKPLEEVDRRSITLRKLDEWYRNNK